MAKYTFDEIKEKLSGKFTVNFELELTLYMYGKEYMIIVYDENHCSFQRCGLNGSGSGEINYTTLDELYNTETVDNIILKRDWDDVTDFECADYEIYFNKDF